MEHVTPIYILSGFLGSGKTTLLSRMIAYWKAQGLRPAIVMNEIGEVNIDGLIAGENVPTAEMLSGCICCSIRADLTSEIAMLVQNEKPDVIVIEATGIANPMEILDAVAEASLYMRMDVKKLITVVDTAHLLHLSVEQKGKTYRLMQEQIRSASVLLLNKTDRVSAAEKDAMERFVHRWNPYAPILPTERCDVNLDELLGSLPDHENHPVMPRHSAEQEADEPQGRAVPEGVEDQIQPESSHAEHSHHSHDHVMSYTYYFSRPVNSEEFENFIAGLPRDVYRAKGVLTFSDTNSRFLFQYAFRESDFMKITPQGRVPDVVVFIGEHFNKSVLQAQLEALEGKRTSV
ncbi:GTP-binding protein [Paenibacillus sp. FSL K6-1566]|uniref:CobW family GTP-binding protein n=1 Tax=Paenibacillus sp. FSL K6-1566 TaxID=2954515 RepID=UPI00310109F8